MGTNIWTKLPQEYRPLMIPGVWDGFTARLAEHFGFKGVLIGGYHAGATVGSAEPLMSAAEVIDVCRHVRRATSLPIRVDVGAGFGDPMHVVRLVHDLRMIDVHAMSIEDQVYPKQAHYHNDYREQVISLDRMLEKVEWARKIGGEHFYICARTDTFSTHGIDEVVRRCNAFLDVGADAVQAFPPTLDDARALSALIKGPIWYVNTRGNRVGRPTLTPREAVELGYTGLLDGHAFFFAAYAGIAAGMKQFTPDGGYPLGDDEIATRNGIEEVLNFDALYKIEAATILARS